MANIDSLTTDKQFLLSISQQLLRSENVQQTADIIIEALSSKAKSFGCAFFRFESSHRQLICISYASRKSQGLESIKLKPIKLGVGVVGHAAVTRTTQNIIDRNDCDEWLKYIEGNVSELTVPIVYDDTLIAIIDLEDERVGYFTPELQRLVESVASLLGKFLYQQVFNENVRFKLEQMDYNDHHAKSKDSYSSMILEQLSDPVFTLTASGKIIDLNQSAVLSLGYAKNELIGQRIQKIEQILETRNTTQLYKKLKLDEPVVVEGIHTRKDGTRFFVEVKMACLEDGNIIAVARDISKRRQVMKDLEDSREFLHDIIKTSPDVIYTYDFIRKKLTIGAFQLSKLLGYTDNRFTQNSDFLEVIHPDDANLLKSHLSKVYHSPAGQLIKTEARLRHADGGYRWLQTRCLVFKRDDKGMPISKLGSVRDVTEKHLLKVELDKRDSYYRALVENAFDGIALYDKDSNLTFCSSSALKLLEYTEEDVNQMQGLQFIHPDDQYLAKRAWDWVLDHPGQVYRIPDYRILKKNGESVWVENTFINLLNDPSVNGIISNFRDISYKKLSEQSLYKMSNYDSLTELPNRHFLKRQLSHYVSQAKKHQSYLTLVYFDVIQLNLINNAWGHSVGDDALLYVSSILQEYTEDFDFIARAGDDEFIIILDQKDSFEATKLVESILSKFDSLIKISDADVKISIRAGITRYPEDGDESEELLSKAEITCRKVKSLPTQYAFYEAQDTQRAKEKLLLEKDLIRALNNDGLELFYQPKVCIRTGVIDSLEALLRWKHPEKGYISPQLIISIAEETNLIYRLTDWVLTQAIKLISEWSAEGIDMKVSVNLSAKDLLRDELIKKLADCLEKYQVSPHLLDIEITESAALTDMKRSTRLLQSLQAMGLSISLDDFGTGYSSISHLTSLPVNLVKIDQSFIRRINEPAVDAKHDNRLIIKNIIQLARSFQLTSLVEGVETTEQLELLMDYDCDLVQGYLFSQPVPAEVLKPIVIRGKIDFKDLTNYSVP